jgi:predicted MFS family arabinose efflux permease
VLLVNRASNREALQPVVSRQSLSLSALRGKGSALLVGCVSWVAVSSSIVFLPSFFDDRDLGVVRAVGTIVLLSSSALAQIFSPKLTRVFPGLSGAGLLAAGIALELVGSLTGSTALAIVGFALAGAGLGVAYRLGLLKLTRGASPAQQGALSSLYAAITYAVAAAAVLGAGALGSTIGLESTTYIVFTITAVAALVLWPGAPRLRDVVEPSA